jgi:hypothetical protein
MSVSAADLEKILLAGENLPLQEYVNLYNKVKNGGTLSPTEGKRYKELQEEVKAKFATTQAPAQTDAPPIPQSFKNALEIEQYLTSAPRNWKIKKSSLYNHIKARKLISEADGTFTLAEVERYAMANLRKADGSVPKAQITEADKAAMDAANARCRRELAQASILENKLAALQGSLVPRDLFEQELAARASIFRSDGENFFRSQASAIVNIVSGDPAKVPDLIAFCLENYEQHLARYLQKEEFKVDTAAYERIFERADKDEEETDIGEERED